MNNLLQRALNARKPACEIEPFILGRWSPRAMTGEVITDKQLIQLLEAARWAPSSYNDQPWRFIYARRDTDHWNRLFDLLGEWNQTWCKNAGALMVIAAKKDFKKTGKPNVNAEFDTGAAWMALALQGASMGLVVHGMAGFDYARAASELSIPEDHVVLAMCAVGHLADKKTLPEDLQEMENPSDRIPVSDFASEGMFQ